MCIRDRILALFLVSLVGSKCLVGLCFNFPGLCFNIPGLYSYTYYRFCRLVGFLGVLKAWGVGHGLCFYGRASYSGFFILFAGCLESDGDVWLHFVCTYVRVLGLDSKKCGTLKA